MNKEYIALGVDGDGQMWDDHFGMSPQYYIYDRAGALVEKRLNPYGVGGDQDKHHGTPQLIVDLLPECGIFIARHMDQPGKIAKMGVQLIMTEERDPQAAIAVYLSEGQAVAQEAEETTDLSWQDSKDTFEIVDVRTLRGNFLPMIQKKAAALPVGQGLRVIQSFEPVPLYTVLGDMGFEHETIQVAEQEYHAYFYRAIAPDTEVSAAPPLQPLGILKFKQVDAVVAGHLLKVWERIYQRQNAAIDQKTLYLVALGVGIGAGRMRQATRELIKAYDAGATVEELDEIYALFIWLEGASTFVSEISTSPAFGAYMLIKQLEEQGKARQEIVAILMDRFGEQHPEVGIFAGA